MASMNKSMHSADTHHSIDMSYYYPICMLTIESIKNDARQEGVIYCF